MSCNLPVEKGFKEAADCKCYSAVMRTFRGMSDEPDIVALDAALRVYRYHHPEDSRQNAFLTVERWVNAEHIH